MPAAAPKAAEPAPAPPPQAPVETPAAPAAPAPPRAEGDRIKASPLARRLAEAQRQLIATDLPIALIGYRNGYQNNAAFTRAFGRRFGLSPSTFRTTGIAA